MIADLRDRLRSDRLWLWVLVGVILLASAAGGYVASPLVFVVPVAGFGVVVLLQRPALGLFFLVVAALVVPISIGTGTEVAVNPATLLVPAIFALWVLDMIRRNALHLVPSRINRPLLLFLAAGLLSLLIGTAIWDPLVPRSGNFLIVQLAQWAVFAFSAIAFWLTGNLVPDQVWLRRLTFLFLTLAGTLAILRVAPGTASLTSRVATFALDRAPFWLLLTALAGGQLIFNRELSSRWRLFLGVVCAACLLYVFFLERATASNWVGVAAALGVLAWLRFPRLRWPVIVLLVVLGVSGVLSSTVYNFAGGEAEWLESGGSRLVLIQRVVQVSLRNPITGLGPAAYRPYASMEPLLYQGAFWNFPRVNSHNNYVDLFSHVGLLGLGLFIWIAVEVTLAGLHLRTHFSGGFAAGYVNGMLAAGAGALVLMMLADWILPFVYNIGFPGFQASVLVWLFLGGLVALEQTRKRELAG